MAEAYARAQQRICDYSQDSRLWVRDLELPDGGVLWEGHDRAAYLRTITVERMRLVLIAMQGQGV